MLVFAATEYINLSWLSSSAAIFFALYTIQMLIMNFPVYFFAFAFLFPLDGRRQLIVILGIY